jgi:hypothetical protein
MSGPKVINIEAIRRRQKRESLALLQRLELALADCDRWQESESQTSSVMDRLRQMQEAGLWEPLIQEAGKQCGFYEEEARRLRQRQVAAQAASLRRAHRLLQGATQMTAQLQTLPDTPERDRLLGQLRSADPAAQQSALGEALDFIGQQQQQESSSRLRELAAGLMDPDAVSSNSPLPQLPADPQELRLEKCWALLAELSAVVDSADSPELQGLTEKARRTAAAPADQQTLLLDSLALELSSYLQNRRTTLALRKELALLLAELEELHSPAVADWKQRLTAALGPSAAPLEATLALAQEARSWVDQTFAEETRQEQRAAVLRALSAAGYEVREGMTTAWVEQGRIVLRKPGDPAYGVELSAPSQGNAVQSRVVAFNASGRDPLRDREVEETWCNEFEKARDVLSEEGFQANLVHAHPAGAIPLKAVPNPAGEQGRDVPRREGLGGAARG